MLMLSIVKMADIQLAPNGITCVKMISPDLNTKLKCFARFLLLNLRALNSFSDLWGSTSHPSETSSK